MSGIEVLNLVLAQIADLRIPMREQELRDQLSVIMQNLEALKAAMEKAREEEEDVSGGRDSDHPVEG